MLSFFWQIMFVRELISLLTLPPPWLKMPSRRGTFFNPLPVRRISLALPKLLRRYGQQEARHDLCGIELVHARCFLVYKSHVLSPSETLEQAGW